MFFKISHKKNQKTSHRMGENIFKSYIYNGVFVSVIYKLLQFNKMKNPI